MQQLTSGAIQNILNGSGIANPVLQVLGTKLIAGSAGNSADRYRVLLSDGISSYSSAMLATQLNHLITDGRMDNLCIIQLNRYVCNVVQNRHVLILLELEVMVPGSSVGSKLGNPQPHKPSSLPAESNDNEPLPVKAAAHPTNGMNNNYSHPPAEPEPPKPIFKPQAPPPTINAQQNPAPRPSFYGAKQEPANGMMKGTSTTATNYGTSAPSYGTSAPSYGANRAPAPTYGAPQTSHGGAATYGGGGAAPSYGGAAPSYGGAAPSYGGSKPGGPPFGDGGTAGPTRPSGQRPTHLLSLTPNTPGGGTMKVTPISGLTPYQNGWSIRARVSQKSNIRTWSNSKGEGKLFSMNLLDDSGEIKATAFKEQVDKYYDCIEIGKVYYLRKASVKTADKRYSSLSHDWELTFNAETQMWPCEDADVNLPTLTFNFIPIGELQDKEPQSSVDVIAIVKAVESLSVVTGRQSNKEVKKRDLILVDRSQVQIRLTLWGSDAESFEGAGCPVLAVKGCRLSDFNGRSLSALSQSQLIVNPDLPEAHVLRGWYDQVGNSATYQAYQRDGGSGHQANWKTFSEVKADPGIGGDAPLYYTTKATIIAIRRENCMYMACPTEQCNKKLVDQNNGFYRCEKCGKEFQDFKWRMILSMNLADFTENTWATAFQDSAEAILGKTAQELGEMKQREMDAEIEEVFQRANFQSFTFRLRAKVESYNDENRLKTVCMQATPINHAEHARKLIKDIEALALTG